MICERCGFETGPSAKFCSVCGCPVTPMQMPEPVSYEEHPVVNEVVQKEILPVAEEIVSEAIVSEEIIPQEEEVAEDVQPVEITTDVDAVFEEIAAEPYEVPVYNSEMIVAEEPVEEAAPVQEAPPEPAVEVPPVIPAEPALEMPPVIPGGNAPENAPVPPVFPGMPMYGVPTGQMYNGIPVYAMPNVAMYNGAPNAQDYNGAPNSQAYNAAPNAPGYNGAPVYPPMYNVPGYGAPVQAYPGGPVYAAPVYAPQGAPVYAPGYYGAEPVKEKPKTVSILALLGGIVAIIALFLNLIGDTEVSIFKIISESLPDLFDSLEYIDRFTEFDYLVLGAVAVSVLCTLCSVLVFVFACLKKKCRVTAFFGMLLIISLIVLFFVLGVEFIYGGLGHLEMNFDLVLDIIKGLGVGFWLYFGGMFVALIGGGKR